MDVWTFTIPPFPSTLKLETIPPPIEPGPNHILVQVKYAALNPVDVQLANARIFKLGSLSFPKGIGSDYSGVVLAKGAAVTEFNVGDEIMGLCLDAMGKPFTRALSKVIAVNAKVDAIIHKPAPLSFASAASLPLVFLTAATVLSAPYTLLPPSPPTKPTVVILGGSTSVGIYVIQYALKKLDVNIIVTCSTRNVEFVRSLGAKTIIDYTKESIADRLAALKPVEGYISIVDCVGGTSLIPLLPTLLTPRTPGFKEGGIYVTIVGDKTDRTTIGGSLLYLFNFTMVRRAFWSWWGSTPRYACISLRQERGLLKEVEELLSQGLVVPIDEKFAFADTDKAFEKLAEGKSRGKIVVNVAGSE